MEKRTYRNTEARASVDGGKRIITGYAAVYDAESHDLGGYREIIRKGAFDESLAESPDVSARVQHLGGLCTIGRTSNNTLRLKADAKGLWYSVTLPDTAAGRDVYELVRRGDLNKSSFAFTVRGAGGERWNNAANPPLRELLSVNVHDVAPVDGAAYGSTSVSVEARARNAERALWRRWLAETPGERRARLASDYEESGRRLAREIAELEGRARPNIALLEGLEAKAAARPGVRVVAVMNPRTGVRTIGNGAFELDGRELPEWAEGTLDDYDYGLYLASLPAEVRAHRRRASAPAVRISAVHQRGSRRAL